MLIMFHFLICFVVTWVCSLYDLCTSIKNSFEKKMCMALESENPKLKSQVCHTSRCVTLVKSLNLSKSQRSPL